MKCTNWLADHNEVTQPNKIFLQRCVLILRTISRHTQITYTTAQLYCTLSTYVPPKTISLQNQKTNTTPQLYCTLLHTISMRPLNQVVLSQAIFQAVLSRHHFPPYALNFFQNFFWNFFTVVFSPIFIFSLIQFPRQFQIFSVGSLCRLIFQS